MTGRRKCRELVAEFASFVEQFVCPVALHPVFQLFEMLGVFEIRDRHLMRAPGSLHRLAVHELWAGPAFRRAEHDHRPARPLDRLWRGARSLLDPVYFRQDRIKRAGQTLMHQCRDVAFHKMRLVAVAADQVG